MVVLCMNYWYIFWPGKANTRKATWTFSSFYLNMILACSPVLPVTAIYKNRLYMILVCVAKCWSHAWIIGIFLARKGQHKKSYMNVLAFLPQYDSGLWACSTSDSYIRTAYTWFWLVWPNAGLTHELLVHFLARRGQHKNSYMDVLVFLRQYDSGLCICSTSDSNVQENPIRDSGLCGQMPVLCMNYWYIFWPGKANTRRATWTFSSFLPQYDSGLCACSTSDSYI